MRLYRPHIFGNCTTLTEQLLSRKIGKKFLKGIQEIRRMNEEENKKENKMMQDYYVHLRTLIHV